MLVSKIKALNCPTDESSDDEGVPVKITKETEAELQYSQVLQYLAEDQLDKAEEQLNELLESDIICSLNSALDKNDKSLSLLIHLKYCCLINLGNILLKKLNYSEALNYYQEALVIDRTDLNLWYKIGLVHTKLYQTDQATTAFLEGIKCNPNHWPTLDKLITLLYVSNEYVSCLHYISKSLKLDSGYLKGHFMKEIMFNKFPGLISYFKSFCLDGGLDIECPERIDDELQRKILSEVDDLRRNDPTLCVMKTSNSNLDSKPTLYAKPLAFKNWENLGGWLIQIYDNIFENYDHSFLYDPIEFKFIFPSQNSTNSCIFVDEKYIPNNFEKPSFKSNVPKTIRSNQLKLSRRSSRNKSNSKVNESALVKSVWTTIPKHLLVDNNSDDKVRRSDDLIDTMDFFRFYEFSDILSDNPTKNLLKNKLSNMEHSKPINHENYFGSNQEKLDSNNFIKLNNRKSISELLEMFLVMIAHKWSNAWPSDMIQLYVCLFKRVWTHTSKQSISYLDLNLDLFDDEKIQKIKDEIISILTYGELLCDLYFQQKLHKKPLEGSVIGGDFCSLWIGSIEDAISILDLKGIDNKIINIRFLWFQALFHLQDKEIGLTCGLLNMLLDFIENDDFEIILPNLEYFFQINKTIIENLVTTLRRNYLLSTIEELHESKEYLSVVNILKETLNSQNCTFIEVPNYPTMAKNNQYRYMLSSLFELKNSHELFKWCEPSLYESILQYCKSLMEDNGVNQKINLAEFINNIVFTMLEVIKIDGLNVFDNLTQRHKLRLIQSVIYLLSYLIESPDGNLEINVIYPWLLIFNLLKNEESKNDEPFASKNCIPPSLSLLIIGHEFLGKRSWCCFEDGIFLFLMLSEIESYIHLELLYALSLVQQVDQIFYCLYTHLTKCNKPRHVQDHNTMGLPLTWPRAIQLVGFHYPSKLPSFDSFSKVFSINTDAEIIFKKVIDLIPEEIKPNRLLDDFMAYLKGETYELPVNKSPLPENVKDIFYLMADFNFKNKNWSKAIWYYLLDLCNDSERFDSWAAMSLAHGSQIEIKLNSCESIINKSDVIKQIHMTDGCFKHSLKLRPENTSLLIEYGTFSYSIHSFFSRILKQEISNMNIQMFRELESQKELMVKTAKKCFQAANDVWSHTNSGSHDKRWLHYYILGKITEKNDDNPTLFIDYYLKAVQFLYSYGAILPDHITHTSPQLYSIEIVEMYFRVHAGVLKLIEKHDIQSLNEDIYIKIKGALNQVSSVFSIFDKNKKTSQILGLDLVNSTYIMKDDSNIPVRKIQFSDDSTFLKIANLQWELIQRCIAALEDCIKRYPQHYKSYYRLARFYFRSPHKDYSKFIDLMFGEQGLFGGQKPNNFFHGIWKTPSNKIDRPGSFSYHMNRSIHLLLDFLKETGDHKTLLDLAIKFKNTPNIEKKYLRDNEREDISKKALFCSIQILKKLKFEYAKANNHNQNEVLLIKVYKSYKSVFKYWQQKDNSLLKLLLNVYQNISGTKKNISIDIIIKYCQKLQTKEKRINHSDIENNVSSVQCLTSSRSTCKLNNTLQAMSTPCSMEKQKITKQVNPQQTTYSPPFQSTQEIMSVLASCSKNSSSVFPLSLEKCSYSNTSPKKLAAKEQKLKEINNKQKTKLKRLTNNKLVKINNNLPNSKPVKNSINKSNESKIVLPEKLPDPMKELRHNNLNPNNFLNSTHNNFDHFVQNLDSPVEIIRLPNKMSNVMSLALKSKISDKLKPATIKPDMVTSEITISKVEPSSTTKSKILSQKSESITFNLDSAVKLTRPKSTILQNYGLKNEKTTPVPITPAMLLSSCPGITIVPVVSTNNKINFGPNEFSMSSQIQDTSKIKNCDLEHFVNSVTINKVERKMVPKIQCPE